MNEHVIGLATEIEITEMKSKNPQGIYSYEVDGHIAYFANPTRKHIAAGISTSTPDNPFDLLIKVANMTYLAGSREILMTDDLFRGFCTAVLRGKIDGKKGQLVNL